MDDLTQIERSVWSGLNEAIENGSDWRLPVLGTGGRAEFDMRTVVLRSVDQSLREIVCHSDARAKKVAAIRDDSTARWLFYDRDKQIQVKAVAKASVHLDDAIADRHWKSTPVSSRRAYLAPYAPGERTEQLNVNLPEEFRERLPTDQEVEVGRKNFAVISTVVQSIEWLGLDRTGNRRAIFEYGDHVKSSWVTP